MAGILKIDPGTRFRLALDPGHGEEPVYDMVATFHSAVDEAYFLISVPLRGTQPLEIDDGQRILLSYSSGSETMLLAAYRDEQVRVGIRTFWKMRLTGSPHQLVSRADVRVKAAIKVLYWQDTWKPDENGEIEHRDAMTLDISSHGAGLFLNHRFQVGEVCFLSLPKIGAAAEGEALEDLVGIVCWVREAPKGSVYRYYCGLQLRFKDDAEQDRMAEYTKYVKRRYRL